MIPTRSAVRLAFDVETLPFWARCYETFYGRNLQLFVINWGLQHKTLLPSNLEEMNRFRGKLEYSSLGEHISVNKHTSLLQSHNG